MAMISNAKIGASCFGLRWRMFGGPGTSSQEHSDLVKKTKNIGGNIKVRMTWIPLESPMSRAPMARMMATNVATSHQSTNNANKD